jgi:hypothetical protein
MLDFYLIRDDQPKYGNSKRAELQFAGELDYECFENLKAKGLIDDRFDYYTDFRWGTDLIKQISEKIDKKVIESDSDIKKLIELLNMAIQNKCGLIAYSD